MRFRSAFTFRLRHRVGKSFTSAWTVKGIPDSQTPGHQSLVLIQKFGRGKGTIHVPVDELSIHPLIASDVGHTVFCLYSVDDMHTFGILMELDKTGSNVLAQVKFVGEKETTEVQARFLVRVMHS